MDQPDAQIKASRKALANPYAHLDGDGGYDAIPYEGPRTVNESRRLLRNPYAFLDVRGGFNEYLRPEHGEDLVLQDLRSDTLLGGKKKGQRFSRREIAAIVRKLQIVIWKNRESIWPEQDSITPNEIVDPAVALRLLGYRLDLSETLGQFSSRSETFEVAGTVDDHKRRVQISRRFSPQIRNFTTAHELGHAVLHQANGLHRDRAQDGSSGSASRNEKEIEADMFAAYFLMPEKLVKVAFREMFLTDHFMANEETAFALGFNNIDSLEKKCRTLRDISKLLASTERYNIRFFRSLAQQFGVSIESMAIQIEEFGLVSR